MSEFSNLEYQKKFWHSSAHILGMAILEHIPEALLSNGPPTQEGFFYDFWSPSPVTPADLKEIESICIKSIKKNYKFEQKFLPLDEVKKFYKDNKYKLHFLPEEDNVSVYKSGPFMDMCMGPHINCTSEIKSFKLLKNSSSYFLGQNSNDQLQRIYGISFPTKKEMEEYLTFLKESAEKDHRKIGAELDLMYFDVLSPGSPFFLPAGTIIYNRLIEFLRTEYRKRGYKEVISPNLFDIKLWKISGHYDNYKDDMYLLNGGEEIGLKPMNCPGHCLIYKRKDVSYKELPIKFADFGVLHRNEIKGALSGLTRLRRFQQDDAHIFCTLEQVSSQVQETLDFLDFLYKKFNFTYELKLSTRPEKFLGEVEMWDFAENELKKALEKFTYEINEKDGAFYGPKIDVILQDALRRKHQCGTIQLDFQLPIRFNLQYNDKDGIKSPVIIHRAIFGSLERFIAIILESFTTNLPFWLSPYQLGIIAVKNNLEIENYILKLKEEFFKYEIEVFDDPTDSLNKKIRNALLKGTKVILVIGKEEVESLSVNVRVNKKNMSVSKDKLKEYLEEMCRSMKDLELSDFFK